MVVTNDTPVHGSPESETIRFHDGLLVVTLHYAYTPPLKLVGMDVICNGRRRSFPIQGDYYAYWNNPFGQVEVDRRGRFLLANFSISRTDQIGAKSRNQGLVMDCDRHSMTFDISERGPLP